MVVHSPSQAPPINSQFQKSSSASTSDKLSNYRTIITELICCSLIIRRRRNYLRITIRTRNNLWTRRWSSCGRAHSKSRKCKWTSRIVIRLIGTQIMICRTWLSAVPPKWSACLQLLRHRMMSLTRWLISARMLWRRILVESIYQPLIVHQLHQSKSPICLIIICLNLVVIHK